MPIDPSRIPALEEELFAAKRPSPGGQPSDPARVAAVEHELKIHRAEAKRLAGPVGQPADVDAKVEKAKAAAKPEKAVAAPAVETTDA